MFHIDWSDTRPVDIVQALKAVIFCQLREISAALPCPGNLVAEHRHSHFWRLSPNESFTNVPLCWRGKEISRQTWKGFEEGLSRAHSPVMAPVVRDLEQSWLQ